VTGLVDGTPYTFTTTASSMVGTSGPSSPSAPVSPLPVPDAPESVLAVPTGSDVAVGWIAPADNGSAVTGYVATASPGGQSCTPAPPTDTTCTILGLPDGQYEISLSATNAIGTGPTATVKVTVDTLAPAVSAPTIALRSGLSMTATSVPVTIGWTAADAMSGIADTTLERAFGAGVYVDQALASPLATSLAGTIAASSTAYRFRDRALDASGNVSGWSTGTPTYVSLHQETGKGIVYHGTWAASSSGSALGGKVRYTSSKGAYVTYTFTGRGFSFVSRKGSTSGKATIYLDGKLIATVDLHAGSTAVRWVAYAWTSSTSKKHVLKIVDLATSGRPRLYVDGFATIR
jgi:hypothetical protein